MTIDHPVLSGWPAPLRVRLGLFVLLAIAVRAITFGNPLVHIDEQYYFVVADAMRHGAIPYVDIWDRKPIGLFLIYLPAAFAGPVAGIYAYQAVALACVILTALMIARLADQAGWRRGAIWAGALYILWLNLADGQGGQSPVFYTLLMVAAITLASPGEPRRRWHGPAAMLLVGLAMQIKYSVVFEGIFIGLWLLGRAWRDGSRVSIIPYAAALVLTALLPTLAVAGFYAAIGQEEAFLYANFVSVMQRGPDPLAESLTNLLLQGALLGPLLLLAALGIGVRSSSGEQRARQLFAYCWLVAAVLGLLVFGSWYNHYALPVIAPGTLCSAAFLGHCRWGRRIALPLALIVAVGGQVMLFKQHVGRGTPAEFRRLEAAVGGAPGCLLLYQGEPMLYATSGRCTVTRYRFPSHLNMAREAGAIGADQAAELRQAFARRPAYVVTTPPYHGERPEMRQLLYRLLRQEGYRLETAVPMGSRVDQIYRRR